MESRPSTSPDKEGFDPRYAEFRKRENEFAEIKEETLLAHSERIIKEVKENLEKSAERFEKIEKDVEQARNLLETEKSNFIKRILEAKKIAQLKLELQVAESILESEARDRAFRERMLQSYEKIVQDERALTSLLEEAYKENAEFDAKKRREFLREEEIRDVAHSMVENNLIYIHSIAQQDEYKPTVNNTIIQTENLSVMDQARIVHGIRPTISCSTLREHTTDGIFAKREMGLLIAGGRVAGASTEDMLSKTDSISSRTFDEKNQTVDAIQKSFSHGREVPKEEYETQRGRVHGARDREYNEVIVQNPEAIGVYFAKDFIIGKPSPEMFTDSYIIEKLASDEYDRSKETKLRYELEVNEKWWSKVEEMVKEKIPVFILNGQNEIYSIYDFDATAKTFSVTSKLEPRDLVSGSYRHNSFTQEDRREKSAKEVASIINNKNELA